MSLFSKTVGKKKPVAASKPATETAPAADASNAEEQLVVMRERIEALTREKSTMQAQLERKTRELATAQQQAVEVRNELQGERVRTALINAAAAHNAIDPDEVAEIMRGRVQYVDGKIVSKDDPAKTHDEVVKEYLATKAHHVRAQVAPGSGSPPRAANVPATAPAAGAPKSLAEALTKRIGDLSQSSTAAPNSTPKN